jgi:dethiobiotin synthetase
MNRSLLTQLSIHQKDNMLELFITGTEQNQSKRYVTAGLALTMQSLGYSVGVYKPVGTGAIALGGALKAPEIVLINYLDSYINTYSTYTFAGKEDPIVAAYANKTHINPVQIIQDYQNIANAAEIMLTEGTNGLSTPLAKGFLEEDLIRGLNLPVLFTVSGEKTPVNSVIMAINRANALGMAVRGVVINDFPIGTTDLNIKTLPGLIEEYTDVRVLGVLGRIPGNINPNDLISTIITNINIESILQMKIAKLSA